jgi:ATP-dependent Clp protease adaptor protein ClpS
MPERSAHPEDLEGELDTLPHERVKQPRRFHVVVHNDDYTTQEFVVLVLVRHFHKSMEEATRLMLQIHKLGKTIVGTYTRDVAESKVQLVTAYAREHEMPLLLTAEAE